MVPSRRLILLAAAFAAGLSAMTGCGDDGGGGVSPDTTAPVITSGPTVSLLTTGAATITWSTNEASNSVVRYGPDTTYAFSGSVATLDTGHEVTIGIGFEPDSTIYYRVESTDAASNTVHSDGSSLVVPAAVLAFAPDTLATTVSAGPFTLNLEAEAVTHLFQAGVRVTFAPSVLRCDSITAGLLLGGPSEIVVLGIPDNGAGAAEIGITRLGGGAGISGTGGISGSGTLAVFHFTPLAPGNSPLTFDAGFLELRDQDGADMVNLDALERPPGFVEVTGP